MHNCKSNTLLQYNLFTSKTTKFNITISHVDHLKESKITEMQLSDSMHVLFAQKYRYLTTDDEKVAKDVLKDHQLDEETRDI